MKLSFENQVALVTGAASGMGLATARAFAEAGAAVVLADFKEDAVKAETRKLVAGGHKALAVRCDVSDDAQVAAMVDRTVAEFGRLDAAFNNAGVMARIAPTADSTREDSDRVIEDQLARGVELDEARAASDGTPGQRRDRQQRIGGRLDW
jgi:NAD(P)-dependent dehydrogenase (short-subunit alcohol dehydrogenase family)